MIDTPLTCNLISCQKKLNTQACVTCCSHIFCAQHTNALKGKDKQVCLACGTPLNRELDVVCVDLNPTEQYKTVQKYVCQQMILTGLTPDQIMDITTRAIGFYVYQLNYNCKNKETLLHSTKEQINEMRQYCTALMSKFKTDLMKEQKKAANLKQELEERIKEVELQQQQVAQWKRANKKLQFQIESQRREIINLKIPTANKVPGQLSLETYVGNGNFSNYFSTDFQLDRVDDFGSSDPAQFKPFGRFSH